MDATPYEWSPAERFVSGAAPSATSPTVDEQSVPRFMQFGPRQSPGNRLQRKPHLAHLTTWEVPVDFFRFLKRPQPARTRGSIEATDVERLHVDRSALPACKHSKVPGDCCEREAQVLVTKSVVDVRSLAASSDGRQVVGQRRSRAHPLGRVVVEGQTELLRVLPETCPFAHIRSSVQFGGEMDRRSLRQIARRAR